MESKLSNIERAVLDLAICEEYNYPEASHDYMVFRDSHTVDEQDEHPISALRQYVMSTPAFGSADITFYGIRQVIEAVDSVANKWPGFSEFLVASHVHPYKGGIWNVCNILEIHESISRMHSPAEIKRSNPQYWALKYPTITESSRLSQFKLCDALASFAGNWPGAPDAEVIEIVLAGI